MKDSDIRVVEIEPFFSQEKAREPLKFGAVVVPETTYCHIRARVENRRGTVADGWGAIFVMDFWAFPTPRIEHPVKDRAMRRATELFCQRTAQHKEFAHPIDIFLALEDELRQIADEVTREFALVEPFPFLAALVCASPVDAALHDAFGIATRISTYDGYGPDFMTYDLSRYLGSEFRGRYLSEFIQPHYAPAIPVFHLVGGLDKLRESEVGPDAPDDGLPNSLDRWVERDGLTCLKVKLRGTDIDWDVNRILEVYRIGREVQARQNRDELYLSADTNEQCDSPAYVVEMLQRVREAIPEAYDAILYIEQPTERELAASRHDMRELASLKPVIVDESLTSLDDMDLALELGWSGVALKTCKCHSMALLVAAKAEAAGIPYTVQDLTNPGLALLHSVGLAARLKPLMGVEANSRQYFPATSGPERAVHPDIFTLHDGMAHTSSLRGPGLGYQIDKINRPILHPK
jgi:L-alanine-DL-glutamate epimerase-like enolase superfamily enzyme